MPAGCRYRWQVREDSSRPAARMGAGRDDIRRPGDEARPRTRDAVGDDVVPPRVEGIEMLRTGEAPSALQTGRDEPAIVVRGLVVGYGDREVLHHIDLTVPPGMVLGFLGPNGAGKTTTVEILEGHRRRAAGDVPVLAWIRQRAARPTAPESASSCSRPPPMRSSPSAETVRQGADYYPLPPRGRGGHRPGRAGRGAR